MILLDTNVVSEAMRPAGDRAVVAWINRQPEERLFICAPILAEIRFGMERMPAGKRREAFYAACDFIETVQFADRILPLDQRAAHACAEARAIRERIGRPMGEVDAMIAGIALVNGLILSTRNVRDFEGIGLELVNPFELA